MCAQLLGSPGLFLLPGGGAATPATIVSSSIILNILVPFLFFVAL